MADPNVIQAEKPKSIQLRSERQRIPFRGPIDSDGINKLHEQMLDDLSALANQGNATAAALLSYAHTLQRETDQARLTGISLKRQSAFQKKIDALQGKRVGLWVDLHDATEISFLEDASIAKRATVNTQFGQATVPMNAVESKTYSVALLGSSGVTSLNVIGTATGSFDKGDGVQNYEGGNETPTIEQTALKNAANGNNLEYWRRRVIFDLESDVSEVEVEVTFQLPDQSNIHANVIYLHAFPLGSVDVTGVWVAPDLSDSFSLIPGFSEVDGAGKQRWFIPAQEVAQVRVRLRQRAWTEENGRKVFEYGLQEIGVQLVEWDKSFDAEASQLADNHTFVARIPAEDGMRLSRLHGFYSTPNFLLEAFGSRHLHFVVSKDIEGTDVVWNSDESPPPQSQDSALELGSVEELFVIVTLNWCTTVGVGSPFQAGCPPWVEGFGVDVTMIEAE